MNALLKEYHQLRDEIFPNGAKFVEIDDNDEEMKAKHKRYDQLFQYFFPQFRTKSFVNPLEETQSVV